MQPQHRMAGYASHLPVLIACVLRTQHESVHPVLELGCGAYSTPVLHAMCCESGRQLFSYETDAGWLEAFKYYCHPPHSFKLVEDWAAVPVESRRWGVVLVDHAPSQRRRVEVERLRGHARLIVCHDTEHRLYRFEDVFGQFKYRVEDRRQSPWTSVVSDDDDLGWLKETLPHK